MAFATGRFDVFRGKNRLLPCKCAAMRFRDGGGGALAAMAYGASELLQLVRNCGMRTEGLLAYIVQGGFFQTDVAAGATVGYAEIGEPDLMNAALEVALQSIGVTAVAN